ncbi:MAG TPA: VOC family protein [Pseudonocardiaceae bacterium]|nr:VOC family protein [Pseudonocardiaceae bacterium]
MSHSAAHRHHAIDYIELTVTDLERAKRFYAEAFGWGFNGYGPEYAGIRSPHESASEVGGLRLDRQVRAGGPLVLLHSADLDQSVDAVTSAGGRMVSGRTGSPVGAGSPSPTPAATSWASGPTSDARRHGRPLATRQPDGGGPVGTCMLVLFESSVDGARPSCDRAWDAAVG